MRDRMQRTNMYRNRFHLNEFRSAAVYDAMIDVLQLREHTVKAHLTNG